MATNQDPDAITGAPAPGSSPPPAQEPRGREKAAQFLANAGEDTSYTYEEEKSVLRRVDLRVLPIVLFAYFFQQLDKSSLSYVSVFGIVEDAKLVNQEYSWLGSILYLAQLVMQPLAAYLLVKLPTGKLLASAIVLWGSSLTIMAACTDFKSLLGLRFCLGAFESMIGELADQQGGFLFQKVKGRIRKSNPDFFSFTANNCLAYKPPVALLSPRCGGGEVNRRCGRRFGTP